MSTQRTEQSVPEAAWFKSSYSTGDGGECVEIAWQKSSYSSSGGGGKCVAVGATPTHVHIRDSKRLTGPILTVGPDAWAGFVGLVAN